MPEQPDPAIIASLGRRLSDATILMHEAIAAKMGLSGTDHKYINIIMDEGALTAGRFAELTSLTTGAVTRVIDRLEKAKLVKRHFDKADRRKVLIVPDRKKVEKLFRNVHGNLFGEIQQLLQQFNSNEVQVIERYMRLTIDVMNSIRFQLNQ